MSLFTAVREVAQGFKSLLVGLRITAREAAKPIITVQYPHETLKMADRFRGHIKLILNQDNGIPNCIACNLCARACPTDCIELDGVKREGDKKKSVTEFMVDFTTCSLCGLCIEACPADALEFSKTYNKVSFNRSDFEKMDMYAMVQQEAEAWAKAHPPTPPQAETADPAPADCCSEPSKDKASADLASRSS